MTGGEHNCEVSTYDVWSGEIWREEQRAGIVVEQTPSLWAGTAGSAARDNKTDKQNPDLFGGLQLIHCAQASQPGVSSSIQGKHKPTWL